MPEAATPPVTPAVNPLPAPSPTALLPPWAQDLVLQYESQASSQFVLFGNTGDRMLLQSGDGVEMGSLADYLQRVLLQNFDVVLSYDLGNGIRVEKGNDHFTSWPWWKEHRQLPRAPLPAVETLTHYFRYCANLARLGGRHLQVGCLLKSAQLIAPALPGALNYDLNALALLLREWSSDSLLTGHQLATFLLTDNLNDLHPLLANNPRSSRIKVPLPSAGELEGTLQLLAPVYRTSLGPWQSDLTTPAQQLAGASLSAIEHMLKQNEHTRRPLRREDLAQLKKQLVEEECNGLIEFVETDRSLADLHGQEKVKDWLRQDLALWQQNEIEAMPMGYLFCGPVGTGKTYMVECLAGEAGVPVVKLKNFRDRWVGSSEGNLETIFRLLQALGRCYVFVDEADQALGQRESGQGDSGISGRIYSMMAEEMSNTRNRGKIVWVLASSRPDLIEVDLKRPGRVDVKIPLFPTTTPEEGLGLIKALCRKKKVAVPEGAEAELLPLVPDLITPGAAESLAIKVFRLVRTRGMEPLAALRESLTGYLNPVPMETLWAQINLAVREASDLEFVPPRFREKV